MLLHLPSEPGNLANLHYGTGSHYQAEPAATSDDAAREGQAYPPCQRYLTLG